MSAQEVSELAFRLVRGLYVHHAAMEFIRDPDSVRPATSPTQDNDPSSGLVVRKDGTWHAYVWAHHTEAARADPTLIAELDRAFLVNALVTLADALAAEDYFDRAPILEMVRQLRNAAVHGNRFDIRDPDSLRKWPAHNRGAGWRGRTDFEITPDLDGTCFLFDYMAAGDVLDVIGAVGNYLRETPGSHS